MSKHELEPAEQKPAAWIIRHPRFCGKFTDDKEIAEHWENKEQGCTAPLYLRPQPAELQPDAAPAAHGSLFLSDEKILEIASNPMVTPCSPWWLKNDVKSGDVQNSAIAFARAVLKAAAPAVQGEPIPAGFALIKLDSRTGKPLVTSEMKAKHIGEYWWDEEAPYYDEHGDLHDYVARHAVPWSLCKEIYKNMASTAMLSAQPAEQQPSPHPDDAAVDLFAAAMKAKLTRKRQEGRGGWQSMTSEQLSALLHEHVRKGDPVDVGNLAMMLHQNGQGIEQKPAPDVTQLVEALGRALDFIRGDGDFEHREALERCECYACVTGEIIDSLAAYRKQGGKS